MKIKAFSERNQKNLLQQSFSGCWYACKNFLRRRIPFVLFCNDAINSLRFSMYFKGADITTIFINDVIKPERNCTTVTRFPLNQKYFEKRIILSRSKDQIVSNNSSQN